MIQGFFNTVQEDVILFKRGFQGDLPKTDEQNKKIYLAGIRMISALTMLFGIQKTLVSLVKVDMAFSTRMFNGIAGVVMYIIGHDFFVMSKNEENQIFMGLKTVGQHFVASLPVIFLGEKPKEGKSYYYLTNGTFVPLFWDELLKK